MLHKIVLVLMMLIVLSGAVVSAGVPPELAGCEVLRIWDFDEDAGGWVPDHNAGPFTVNNGILSFTNTGPDPWITLRDAGGFDASIYGYVGVKMRSSVSGRNEVFFSTDKTPGPAGRMVVGGSVDAGRVFRFHEYDMSRSPLWGGKINLLRIDTANGGGEIGAKIDIDWIAIYQPIEPTLRIGRPFAGRDSRGVFVSIPVTNTRGPKPNAPVRVTACDAIGQIGCPSSGETKTVTLRVSKPLPRIPIKVEFEGKMVCGALLAAPPRAIVNAKPVISGSRSLGFHSRTKMAEVNLLWPDRAIAGVFRPLAALSYLDRGGVQHYIEPCPDVKRVTGDTVVLETTEKVDGGKASFTWTFRLPKGSTEGGVACEMTSTVPIQVLRFEGPRLLAGEYAYGPKKTHGLFPGLEYLEKNEPSSAERHVGPRFADRHVPDPYKITVPVMAIEAGQGVVGVSWDPMKDWAMGERFPCAEFESPSRSLGAANHVMTLFAPSIPDHVSENSEFAATAYVLKPGKSLRIGMDFFARPHEKITSVVPEYYKARGLPKPPPVAHGVEGTIAVCMKAYTETLYSLEKGGWKNHIGLHQTQHFQNTFAASILAESLRTNDPELVRKVKIEPDTQVSTFTGTTLDWFSDAACKQREHAASLIKPDGSYPYEITEEIKKKVKDLEPHSGSKEIALGDAWEKNSGLTLRALLPLLGWAARTGDGRCISQARWGLRDLNRRTVPRGSQTWEVHAHAPDVLAAAHATEANILAYEVTGLDYYLDCAREWAYTGLPFIYAWTPPIDPVPTATQHFDEGGEGKSLTWSEPVDFYQDTRRYINPGAAIAVFGTTMYVHEWFGVPVQWCGMAWANSVRSYIRRRPDQMLETIADAVFASCTQQQFDKGWAAGTFPDSWNLRQNTVNAAFITPDCILDYAYAVLGEKRPITVDYAGFGGTSTRSVLNTYARIEKCGVEGTRWVARLKYYAGQDLWSCISSCTKPTHVEIDGKPLAEASDLKASGPGWFHDAANRALHIKCRPVTRNVALSVAW